MGDISTKFGDRASIHSSVMTHFWSELRKITWHVTFTPSHLRLKSCSTIIRTFCGFLFITYATNGRTK